jgi:hypothetical protein
MATCSNLRKNGGVCAPSTDLRRYRDKKHMLSPLLCCAGSPLCIYSPNNLHKVVCVVRVGTCTLRGGAGRQGGIQGMRTPPVPVSYRLGVGGWVLRLANLVTTRWRRERYQAGGGAETHGGGSGAGPNAVCRA